MSAEPCPDSTCYSIMDYYHYKSLQFAAVGRYNQETDCHRDDVSNDSEITLVQAPSTEDDDDDDDHGNKKKVPQDTSFFSAADHLKTRFKKALVQDHKKERSSSTAAVVLKKRWFHSLLLLHKNPKDKKRKIRYQKKVTVHDTYSASEYNREPDPMVAGLILTPDIAGQIKRELNLFKSSEMEVHPESQMYTHYLV